MISNLPSNILNMLLGKENDHQIVRMLKSMIMGMNGLTKELVSRLFSRANIGLSGFESLYDKQTFIWKRQFMFVG